MTHHPREGTGAGQFSLSRRSLLSAAGLAGLGLALGACGSPAGSASVKGPIPLPRPYRPVTWPLTDANQAIPSGLAPEKNATVKLYSWVAYINQKVLDAFAKKYGCAVEVSTFNTADEAIAKLTSGNLDFDVFFPTVDLIGPLVETGLVQPLNHSYLPNIHQAWSEFTDPFYDQGWRYTVPYTIYTTGIAWRKDFIKDGPETMANPWAFPWQGKYRGKVALLDDAREGISLGLLKNGLLDLNTGDPNHLATATNSLLELDALVGLHVNNNDYSDIPSGTSWIHQAWSGDMVSANGYLPPGTNIDVVGYWFPRDGRGPIANDTMVVLSGGKNPVLAHHLLDYFMDLPNAIANMTFSGYMQPLTGMTAERLIAEGIIPPTLESTVVTEGDFATGLRELAIAPEVNASWQQAWLRVSGGV